MGFKVVSAMRDGKDGERFYKGGAIYPAKQANVTEERIKEMEAGGHIRPDEEEIKKRASLNDDQDLNDLTVDELKEMAKESDIEGYTGMKKKELIAALTE